MTMIVIFVNIRVDHLISISRKATTNNRIRIAKMEMYRKRLIYLFSLRFENVCLLFTLLRWLFRLLHFIGTVKHIRFPRVQNIPYLKHEQDKSLILFYTKMWKILYFMNRPSGHLPVQS